MGAGVPAAIGAQLARPEATVIAFVGDGGFQMTGAEIATALAEDLPIKIIVCDNGAYGTILMHQQRQVGEEYAVRIGGPDFAALARAQVPRPGQSIRPKNFSPPSMPRWPIRARP